MHSVVMEVFAIWHCSLEKGPLRRDQACQFPCLQREEAAPAAPVMGHPLGRKKALKGSNLFFCFGKHTEEVQTSNDDFSSSV